MIKQILNLPYRFFASQCSKGRFLWVNDKLALKWMYRGIMGTPLDIDHPVTFNEKMQWLKLYDRDPLYIELVDKHEVRKHIKNLLGEDFLIPEIALYNTPQEINFDALPDQFVLKCTHDSGSAVVCRDKATFDVPATVKWLESRMKRSHYWGGHEWPYKNVKPRIIIEAFMDSGKPEGLTDYKFYCFNGQPKFMYISSGLEHHDTGTISFFDLQGKFLPFGRADYKGFPQEPQMPEELNDMITIAEKCAKYAKSPFVRVDMYVIKGQIYFSELTFTPCGGYMPFSPAEYDKITGDYLKLSK